MPQIENLRGPCDRVGGLAHFGRMLDKIRLHAAGKLSPDYVACLGEADPTYFDGRICRFLKVAYDDVVEQTRKGGSDEAVLEWAFRRGYKPAEDEVEIMTAFISKRGWRDEVSEGVRRDAEAAGMPLDLIATRADFMDYDEGRPLRFPLELSPFTGKVESTVQIENLRSPYATVGGIVHFGRMLDKIRLHHAGLLPEPWVKSLGGIQNYDGRCCRFLRIDYKQVTEKALACKNDEEILAWAFAQGRRPTEEEILIWNAYMYKRSWRDLYTPRLHFRLEEAGMPSNAALTMFDFIDLDEGRAPVKDFSSIGR